MTLYIDILYLSLRPETMLIFIQGASAKGVTATTPSSCIIWLSTASLSSGLSFELP